MIDEHTPQRLRRAGFGERHIDLLDGIEFAEGPATTGRAISGLLWSGGLVIFGGSNGRGKTAMACYLAAHWPRRRGEVVYRRLADLFTQQQATFGERPTVTPMERARSSGLLVLDDVHEQLASPWQVTELGALLDHRYANRRPTLLVHNFGSTEQMRRTLSPAVVDRARDGGAIMRTGNWPNLRANATGVA